MNSKKIASNITYFSLHWVSLTFFGYLFYILMGKMLQPNEYGILFTAISSFYILSVFASMGLHEALPKLIPELMEKNKEREARAMTSFSLKFVLVFSLVVSSLIFIFSENISLLLYGSYDMSQAIRMLSGILFLGTFMITLKGALQGLQKFREIFFGDLLGNVTKIILAVALVTVGYGAAGGIISWIAWFIITSLIFSVFIFKFTKSGKFDKPRLFKYGILSSLSLFSITFIQQGGIIILGMMHSIESSAFFATAFVFGQFIIFVPGILVGATLPSFSELWVKQKEKMSTLLSISIKASIIFTIPLLVVFTAFSDFFIKLFYNDSYLQASPLFPGYLFGSFLLGLSLLLLMTLYSAHRPHLRAGILLLAAASNLILSVVLIPMFGPLGAVISFLTVQTLILCLSLYFVISTIKLNFLKRTLWLIPISLIFTSLVMLTKNVQGMRTQMLLTIILVAFYFMSLMFFKVINKNDLVLLNSFPDRFGGRLVKKILNKMVR